MEGCTDADVQPKPAWVQRKMAYVEHVAAASPSVILVSASDKLHNARAILADYRELGDGLWNRFNKDAGKTGTIGYYRGLVAAFDATHQHAALVRTLDRVVSEIEEVAQFNGVWPPRA